MTRNDMEAIEKILDGERVGYAYLYPSDGSERLEYVFDMTAENMASFIGQHQLGIKKMVLTDMCDRLILDTEGGFLNNCPNQELCKELLSLLQPIRVGEKAAEEFSMVTREIYDEYCQLEDQAVTAAEISML
ncbi:MAG: hypothetical protein NC240_01040 [Clostridium sp.]|nr:hypothetical protein [Clostridium sp.]